MLNYGVGRECYIALLTEAALCWGHCEVNDTARRKQHRDRPAKQVRVLSAPLVSIMSKYDNNYKWIKVKQFRFDSEKSWEENFRALEAHHIEETTFLIEEVRKLAKRIEE